MSLIPLQGDSNGNSNGGSNGLSKRNPPPKRDTANDFNQADGNTGGNNGGYAPTPVSYNPASNGYPSSGNNGYGQNPMYQSEVINSGTRFIEGSGGRSYEVCEQTCHALCCCVCASSFHWVKNTQCGQLLLLQMGY